MADTVTDLLVKVGADVGDAQHGLDSVNKSVAGFGKDLAASASSAGMGLATLGAPLVTFGALAGKTAGDFEAQMKILAIAAGGGSTSLEDLRDVAVMAGEDTRLVGVSAADVAGAMTGFAKAGLPVNDTLGDMEGYLAGTAEMGGTLRAAIDLAAASELDVTGASELAVIAMSTFGLTADEVGGAMNNFVQTADGSVASVQDLADAMQNVGPTMAAFGFPLEDVNNALAILSTRGIKGSEAGTSLKSMFTNMMRPTKEVKSALSNLGITLYDAEGNMRSMPDIIGQLSSSMEGLTEEERNNYVQTLAGTYGMKAMNTLLAGGPAGWDKMASSIANAATMQETAQARTEGFNAATDNLKSSVETFMIRAGTPLIENVLTPLVGKLTTVVGSLSKVNPKFIQLAVVVGGVLAGLGGFLLVASKMITSIMSIVKFVKLLGTAFKLIKLGGLISSFSSLASGLLAGVVPALGAVGAALLPLLPIIAVVAAVAALLYLAWKTNFLGFRDLVTQLGEAIKAIFEFIKGVVVAFGQFLSGDLTWAEFTAKVAGLFSEMSAKLAEIWENIKVILAAAWEAIRAVAATAWKGIRAFLTAVWEGIRAGAATVWEGIRMFFAALWAAITTAITTAWEAIKAFFSTTWTAITTASTTAWEAIKAFFSETWAAITTALTTAWETIKTFFSTTWTAIQTTATTIWNGITGTLATIWTGMKTRAKSIFTGLKTGLSTIWEGIKDVASRMTHELSDKVLAILGGLVDGVFEKGAALAKRFGDGIASALHAALDAARRIADSIRALLPGSDAEVGPLSDLFASGQALPRTLARGMLANAGALQAAANQLAAAMLPSLVPPGGRGAGGGTRGPALGRMTAEPASGTLGGQTINVTINNPRGEPTEASIVRQLKNLAYLGVLRPLAETA